MLRHRVVLWVLVPLGLGGAAFGASRAFWAWRSSGPRLECPAVIDLGPREVGDLVVARVLFANRGNEILRVDRFRVNCACTGFEREKDGKFTQVRSLQLAPGEETELTLRVSVRGAAGGAMRNLISFRTNQPALPEATVEAVVREVLGGISASPLAAHFGTVRLGSEPRQVIEIRDAGIRPRSLVKAAGSDPQRFTVRVLPREPVKGQSETVKLGSVVLARIEVVLHTDDPGPIQGTATVHLDDQRSYDIPVQARVEKSVRAVPPALVLPRASEAGPVYFGECVLKSLAGNPFMLAIESAAPDLSVQAVSAEDDSGAQILRITWAPPPANDTARAVSRSLRFRALVGDEEIVVDVPVICRAEIVE